MKLRILFFLAITLAANTAIAEQVADRCDNRIKSEDAAAFPKSYQAAVELSKALCEHHIRSETEISEYTKQKAIDWKLTAYEETAPLKTVGIDPSTIIDHIYDEILDGAPYIYLKAERSPTLFYRATDGAPIPIVDDNACKTLTTGLSCYRTLAQFGKTTEAINDPSNIETLEETYEKLGLYNTAWDDYFTKARSQTFIELGLNTWRYKDQLDKGENVLPPSSQLIFLHPTAAIEYVDKAVDGQQQKDALIIEWVGMNWWNMSVPLGFSVFSSYTDRTDQDDHALGLMVHINNNYSIGYTHRNGGNGVIITLDLLKIFEDKKTNLDKYKNDIEAYVRKIKK
ncbi:hypothetical protein ACFL3P_02605 [Pseudomonadota bacterium]